MIEIDLLKFFDKRYSILKVSTESELPAWINLDCSFLSLTKTDEELSIVCDSSCIPENEILNQSKQWIIIKMDEILDLSLFGILYSILKILKKNKISVFSISTYNTDYILIKEEDESKAKKCLGKYC